MRSNTRHRCGRKQIKVSWFFFSKKNASFYGFPTSAMPQPPKRLPLFPQCCLIRSLFLEERFRELALSGAGPGIEPPGQGHYFVGSKDMSCQILANELRVEVFPEMTFAAVVAESHRRVREETAALMASIRESIANSPGQQRAKAEYERLVQERHGPPAAE